MKLKISIPENNIKERVYSIRILLDMLLDNSKIEYTFEKVSGLDSTIISFCEKEIRFTDHFWNKHPEDLSFLSANYLPVPIYGTNDFTPESDIPIVFGDDWVIVSEKMVECGIDVFASAFFMLTRWEEYVNPERDIHNRFPGAASTAVKHGFIERPVVNEYVEMIKNMMLALGVQKTFFRKRTFELIPTHDIDKMRYTGIRSLTGDLVKRRSPRLFYKNLLLAIQNPFDTYHFLMRQSEKYGLRSHFYFMSSKTSNSHDYEYYINRKSFKVLVNEICYRGHIIGFHPGYTSPVDSKEWMNQKCALSERTPVPIVEGRQHFLMMDIPATLQIWEDGGMKIDSTLGYADHIGFRCGTGDEFPVFNFLTREQLSLREQPLVVMDGSLKQYMNLNKSEALARVSGLIDISKKYQMSMTILFHNSSFCNDWQDYTGLYEAILDYAR